jgi:hypothetical protein
MPFSQPPRYDHDIEIFYEKIKNKEKFAFSKYADGELHILANQQINNGEFWFNPVEDSFFREKMIESFKYNDPGYYMGISCPCCIGGSQAHDFMKRFSEKPEDRLTWANLFVNGNYDFYLKNIVPLYSNYDVYLVSNSDSNLERLPFEVKKHFKIGKNAWVKDFEMTSEISNFISNENIRDSLFLFCAGPFGNMLVSHLHSQHKNNTYIDIGSTLNPFLLGDVGKNRGYLRGESSSKKQCEWSN